MCCIYVVFCFQAISLKLERLEAKVCRPCVGGFFVLGLLCTLSLEEVRNRGVAFCCHSLWILHILRTDGFALAEFPQLALGF